jgi:hypothetical protein
MQRVPKLCFALSQRCKYSSYNGKENIAVLAVVKQKGALVNQFVTQRSLQLFSCLLALGRIEPSSIAQLECY